MGTAAGAMPASYGASTFGGTSVGSKYSSAFTPGGSVGNFGLGFQLKYQKTIEQQDGRIKNGWVKPV